MFQIITTIATTRMPLTPHKHRLVHPLPTNALQPVQVNKPTKSTAKQPHVVVKQQQKQQPKKAERPIDAEHQLAEKVSESHEDEPATQVFRRRQVWLNEDDELDSMWTIKRANPVFDGDDEEDELQMMYGSPKKRSKGVTSLSAAVQRLDWDDRVQFNDSDDEPLLQLLSSSSTTTSSSIRNSE